MPPLEAEESLESLLQSNRITEVEERLVKLITDSSDVRRTDAALTLADLYAVQGDTEKANRVLDLLDEVPPEHQIRSEIVRGRMALADQRWNDAASHFMAAADSPPDQEPALNAASLIGLADAYQGMNDSQKADRVLRAFVDQYPNSPRHLLTAALNRLEALGAFSGAEPDEDLLLWTESPSVDLKTLAAFHLADAAMKAQNLPLARQHLATLNSLNPGSVLDPADLLALASIHLELDEPKIASRVIAAIPQDRINPDDIHAIEAWTAFSKGDYPAAATAFEKAAERARTNQADSETLTLDAGIAALMAGDAQTIASAEETLALSENKLHASAFALERGLLEAAQHQPEAVESLLALIKEYPDHPQLAEAHVALAEILFLGIPAQPIAAREHLAAARQQPLAPSQAERIDYIAIWVEASAGAHDDAITLSREFIQKWPESERIPSIRYKLGEIYFSNQSYQNSLRHFLIVADQYSDSAYADDALFYAAKSAWLTGLPHRADEAIALWGRLVDEGGPLKLSAWLEQGLAKMELGKEADAIAVFDSILVSDPPPTGNLLHSILTSKGQSAFNLASTNASFLEEAVASFAQVVDDPAASTYWKNQAAVRMAKCHEKSGNSDEALKVYAAVIQAGPAPTIDEPPEFDWFYRAGFAAIRLLEAKEDWRSAVAVAERLSRSGGNRAQEAVALANKLRLEHFIWENAPEPPAES
ncbi:MAG: tetratricopeptide repeat protein [Verrucomicrobiota bacterium]